MGDLAEIEIWRRLRSGRRGECEMEIISNSRDGESCAMGEMASVARRA